jgi:hypothetical protein
VENVSRDCNADYIRVLEGNEKIMHVCGIAVMHYGFEVERIIPTVIDCSELAIV